MKTTAGMLVSVVLATFGSDLVAQEPRAVQDKPVIVRRFFDRPIDYWGRGLGFDEDSKEPGVKGREAKPTQNPAPTDWGQMVKLPDGTMQYRELPRPLVEVLENPTPENIRAYFAFRMSKTQKILRAAELMKEYRASALGQPEASAVVESPGTPELPKAAPEAGLGAPQAGPPKKPAPATPFTVTYFHKSHCPHCDSQDVILAEWLKDKPEGKLEVIEFGMKPELWQAYQVRGTPTLLIEDSGTRQTAFLEGLSRADALSRNLEECRAKKSLEASAKGEKTK